MTTEGETQGNRMLAYSDKKIKKADVHTKKDARAWTLDGVSKSRA